MSNDRRKSEAEEEVKEPIDWDVLVSRVAPIANPLASKKLSKRIYKVVKKANKQKQLRKGVREVQKFIRKGERGIVILAGNTNPIDVISHLPVYCEDNNIPYCYVPAKEDLGSACGSHRQTCAIMIKSHEEYKDIYDACFEEVKSLPLPI